MHFEESLALAQRVGEREREARAGNNLGILALYAGDFETAVSRYEAALALARELGDDRTISLMAQNLGQQSGPAGFGNGGSSTPPPTGGPPPFVLPINFIPSGPAGGGPNTGTGGTGNGGPEEF